jgi:FAD-linked oxidoreductase
MKPLSRREFVAGAALAALAAAPHRLHAAPAPTPWRNWSGNLVAHPAGRLAPRDEDELVTMLRRTSGPLRPVGAGHSFSPLVPTDGHLVVLSEFTGLVRTDPQAMTAELMAGTRLSDAGRLLHAAGQAMFNLPDIDRQTLAGAIATATHGTGVNLKSLSGYVAALRLVTPTGQVLDVSADRDPDTFRAACVSLGALGFVTRITLRNRPPFRLRTRFFVARTEEIIDYLAACAADYQHFDLMPFLHGDYALVTAQRETDDPAVPTTAADDDAGFIELVKLIDRTPVAERRTLINSAVSGMAPGESVDWSFDALTNFRFDRFNEMEYSVPADAGPACLREILQAVASDGIEVAIPLEYRTVAADEAWLSMYHGGPRVAISVHRLSQHDFRPLFTRVEPIFWKYEGRPHWGKVHSLGYDRLSALYPRLRDFVALQESLDPRGRMLNDHLRRMLGK